MCTEFIPGTDITTGTDTASRQSPARTPWWHTYSSIVCTAQLVCRGERCSCLQCAWYPPACSACYTCQRFNTTSSTSLPFAISAAGDHFSAGLDLADSSSNFEQIGRATSDVARRAFRLRKLAMAMQVNNPKQGYPRPTQGSANLCAL